MLFGIIVQTNGYSPKMEVHSPLLCSSMLFYALLSSAFFAKPDLNRLELCLQLSCEMREDML